MNGGFKASLSSLTSYALAATLLLPPCGCAADEREGDGGKADAAVDDARDSDGGETVVELQRDSGGHDAPVDSPPARVDEDTRAAGDSPPSNTRFGASELSRGKSERSGYADIARRHAHSQPGTEMNHGDHGVFEIGSAGKAEAGHDTGADDVEYAPITAMKDVTRLDVSESEPDIPFDGTVKRTIVFEGRPAVSYADTTGIITTHCRFVEVPRPEIGGVYGPFVIVDLVVDAKTPPGVYTFRTVRDNPAKIKLVHHDGKTHSSYSSLEYEEATTVGAGTSVTFKFPGVLTIELTRSKGTSNLSELGEVLFDGYHDLLIHEREPSFAGYRRASP